MHRGKLRLVARDGELIEEPAPPKRPEPARDALPPDVVRALALYALRTLDRIETPHALRRELGGEGAGE